MSKKISRKSLKSKSKKNKKLAKDFLQANFEGKTYVEKCGIICIDK